MEQMTNQQQDLLEDMYAVTRYLGTYSSKFLIPAGINDGYKG